ncbi:MAG: PRD domain-containing protein [Brevefilum sp.]|nr:PRD domain-containing protein [Brevefilum sp.]
MTALTTRQRDMLTALLDAEAPITADDLAVTLNLTTRQVNYGLKGIKQWLTSRDIHLESKPGSGILLHCSKEQSTTLKTDLGSIKHLQLILSADERQQLLALDLLVTNQPKYLSEIEHLAQVSRTTVLKDLDVIEKWFAKHEIIVNRRPNYGIVVEAREDLRQKLITMLLWGESPFGKSLVKINHTQGLIFLLEKDSDLHPLVRTSNDILQKWDLVRMFGQIAYAEAQLGRRFTDDAFLHLALVIAIQTDRISKGCHLPTSEEIIQDLHSLPVWMYAKMILNRSGLELKSSTRDRDIAGIAMWLLAAPRNENLPGDIDDSFDDLISEIMESISDFFQSPEMSQDLILRDGLTNHIIPACLRQKFNLWQPTPYPNLSLSNKYAQEFELAEKVASLIVLNTSFQIPEAEINNVAALLRAARIRLRPHLFRQVLVVCPSGMASAQLLVSRLEARFPRLGPLKVISMRELTADKINQADLIITTVPISDLVLQDIKVIQVHPLLLAEDVEAVTQYIA